MDWLKRISHTHTQCILEKLYELGKYCWSKQLTNLLNKHLCFYFMNESTYDIWQTKINWYLIATNDSFNNQLSHPIQQTDSCYEIIIRDIRKLLWQQQKEHFKKITKKQNNSLHFKNHVFYVCSMCSVSACRS